MNLAGHDIGVCSWSLKPNSVEQLIEQMDELRLDHLQLALNPLLTTSPEQQDAYIHQLNEAEIAITAGMIGFPGENYGSIALIRGSGGMVPSDQWSARRQLAIDAGQFAKRIGIELISLHLGFIPPSNDQAYPTLINRVREVAAAYAQDGIGLLFETGQERASELLMFLNDLNVKNVAVNFDPANMILYGSGDPIEAVQTLGRHIQHVHIKDAIASASPGIEWGREVAFGAGDIDHTAFLRALIDVGYDGPLVIEREAGETRLADVKRAIAKLEELLA